MDDAFFSAFNEDLRNKEAWHKFNTSYNKGKGKLKDAAMQNPSMIGDPVSIKAENAQSAPDDKGASTAEGAHKKPEEYEKEAKQPEGQGKLKDAAMKNPSLLGDPVSMKAEESDSNQDPGTKTSDSTSSIPPEAPAPTVTSLTSAKPSSTKSTKTTTKEAETTSSSDPSLPCPPQIDGKALFWQMMDHARSPDPYIFPALLRLRSLPADKRPVLGALSNTVIFPKDHPYNRLPSVPSSSTSTPSSPSSSPASNAKVSESQDPRTHFDVFIASAEVGMRKPDKAVYELALKQLDDFDREKGGEGVKVEDVLFLDDIGENLKTAREMGMRTVKVQMNKTWRAVKELEGALGGGVELMDERTRKAKL